MTWQTSRAAVESELGRLETARDASQRMEEEAQPCGRSALVIAGPNVYMIHYCWSEHDMLLQKMPKKSLNVRSVRARRLSSRWTGFVAKVYSGDVVTVNCTHVGALVW